MSTEHTDQRGQNRRESEAAVHAGQVVERPFVLLVQPSLFDDQVLGFVPLAALGVGHIVKRIRRPDVPALAAPPTVSGSEPMDPVLLGVLLSTPIVVLLMFGVLMPLIRRRLILQSHREDISKDV